jgi:NAD(P)-dependent dehydrogenase (short-subunit alcohol dehydrogenase family)
MSENSMSEAPTSRIGLVTGGGTGVGKAITKALMDAGWTLVITGRRRDVLDAAVTELSGDDGRIVAVAADIGDPASVAGLFTDIHSRFGRLDLLVNNAGTNVPPIALEDVTFEQWNAIVGANLTGAFLCTQQAFKLFKAQTPRGGRIINNGSISATTPRPNSSPYTATKHAISGLTKATALDGRPFDIACGQIDIGNAASAMTTTIQSGALQANGTTAAEATMDPRYVGNAVVSMAGLPLDVNVLTMTIMATKMPYVGRG